MTSDHFNAVAKSVMRHSGRRWLGFFLRAAAAGLLVHLVLTTVAWAQNGAPQASLGKTAIAVFRTVQDMQASEAANPTPPVAMPPSLPTMDFAQYLALKLAAGPVAGEVKPEAGLAPLPAAPPTLGSLACNGFGQLAPLVQGFAPPDSHGAVGANHYGQIVNSAIRFYTKALTASCPTSVVLNQTLASFFGYVTQSIFDPRLLYDLTYNRWIVSAEAFQESVNVQYQFIAVSVDSDPTHGFFIYRFNVTDWVGPGSGIFWDYPQIGYDEDAVILTGNKFKPVFLGSTAVFLAKHRMYNGLGFSYCIFNGGSLDGAGTFTPPIVLDQGPYTTLPSVIPGANFVRVTKWNNTSHMCPNFLLSSDISTPTGVPPLAQQPGFSPTDTANKLDTLDGRFQSQGTQYGTPAFAQPVKFWQTRTNGSGSFPIPFTYRFNAEAATIEELCSFSLSGSSFDFNPSIVANEAGTLYLTWSATDPPNNLNAQVRMGGKLVGDGCATIGAGVLVNQSANALTGNFDPNKGFQRWGDTSAVTLDPSDHTVVYGVNEKAQTGADPTTWKTYFFNMHNP